MGFAVSTGFLTQTVNFSHCITLSLFFIQLLNQLQEITAWCKNKKNAKQSFSHSFSPSFCPSLRSSGWDSGRRVRLQCSCGSVSNPSPDRRLADLLEYCLWSVISLLPSGAQDAVIVSGQSKFCNMHHLIMQLDKSQQYGGTGSKHDWLGYIFLPCMCVHKNVVKIQTALKRCSRHR